MAENKTKKLLTGVLKYAVPLAISIGLCWLLFTGINFREMLHIIQSQCNYWWIVLALFISIFSHIFRAMRWQIQLRALQIRAGLFELVLSIFGTYAVNLVFPRLGEVWRTGYIAKEEDAPFTQVFGSMVADRLADTVTVLLLTVVTFLLSSKVLAEYLGQSSDTWAAIISVLASPWLWIAVVLVVAFFWWFLTRKSGSPLMTKVQKAIKQLWEGFAVIATMPGKGRWLLLTLCIWGCYFLQLYVAFYAFPFTEGVLTEYGILAALVTFVMSSISMGVPSNGGIGPWQWAVIFALGIYGVGQASAGAFANLVLGSQTLLLILLGIFTFIAIPLRRKRSGRIVTSSTSNDNQQSNTK